MPASISNTVFDGPKFRLYGNQDAVTTILNLGVYATNGIAVTPALFGLGVIYDMTTPKSADGTINYSYDGTNGRVKAYVSATGAEVANGVDLTPQPCRITVLGRRA